MNTGAKQLLLWVHGPLHPCCAEKAPVVPRATKLLLLQSIRGEEFALVLQPLRWERAFCLAAWKCVQLSYHQVCLAYAAIHLLGELKSTFFSFPFPLFNKWKQRSGFNHEIATGHGASPPIILPWLYLMYLSRRCTCSCMVLGRGVEL